MRVIETCPLSAGMESMSVQTKVLPFEEGPRLLPSSASISAPPPNLASAIQLEEGGTDPLHRAIFEAAQKTGFCIAVHETSIIHGCNKGEIAFVKVPIGFPVWRHWRQVHNSSTYHVVDVHRGKMWLFRHRIFRSKSLTHDLLKAREPWFYDEAKILQTRAPLSMSPSRTDSRRRENGEYVPLGAEVTIQGTIADPNAVPVLEQPARVEEGYPVYPKWSRCD